MDKSNVKEALIDVLADMVTSKQQSQRVGYKHDLPAGFTITTNWLHGPNGIFSTPGAERQVFSTALDVRGLLGVLPDKPSVHTHPVTYLLTGFTDESGTEADAVCDDCVKAGETKACRQGTVFGRVCRETDELELNRVGQRTNRGEMDDLFIVNNPLLPAADMWVPPSVRGQERDLISNEIANLWYNLGITMARKLCQVVWTGTPANNSANGGYKEFWGLESLVGTGHTDVIDQTSCPSLDSDIKDANYLSVNNNALQIYQLMQMIYRYVEHNANMMNMLPVQWVWVMKDSLFRELTDRWPCVYATGRCGTNLGLTNNTDALTMVGMADKMYTGRYLRIDGIDIPVIVDDCIPYESNAENGDLEPGTFASDIYLLPLTVRGRIPVTFMEYFNYAAPNGVVDAMRRGRVSGEYWTDAGRWLWTWSRTNWCLSWKTKIEPRLRLLTPHLAGRLENVAWTPLQMFREPLPDQHYFVDGGITSGPNPPYSRD